MGWPQCWNAALHSCLLLLLLKIVKTPCFPAEVCSWLQGPVWICYDQGGPRATKVHAKSAQLTWICTLMRLGLVNFWASDLASGQTGVHLGSLEMSLC